uniref:Dirigent protein n=2 Tax=Opuntia streptacantha TaxID=393608 RepID=A0A7C8ZL98_OPUST
MAKPSFSSILPLLFFFILSFVPAMHASFSKPISTEELGLNDPKQTHLTFYFHDTLSGPNPTAVQIVKASSSATSFGVLTMIDDPLTEGPDPTSRLMGRAQGMYGLTDQTQSALTMVMNFAFLDGDFKGSTVSILGRNPVLQGVREMPVVGGTGALRFAKGYAQARTYKSDPTTGDAVVKYDVYVSHAGSPNTSGNHAPVCTRVPLPAMVVSFLLISLLYLA